MGLMNKKQWKYGILKGKTKGKQGKNTMGRREDLKDRPFGATTEKKKKLPNCRKIALLGIFLQREKKAPETKN